MENNVAKVYLLGKTYLTNNETFYIRNDPIVHMAAGDRHTIIITESGRSYAFGDNSSGQLGLGHTNPTEKVLCIKSLKFDQIGEKVILAACGCKSSLVATNQGSLYAFGSNHYCQLGFESKDLSTIHPHPVKIEYFRSNISWKQLSMGVEHTCVLNNNGEVYVWGSNEYGQCGLAHKFNIIRIPRQLQLEYPVISISCGYYHTALINIDHRLFLFGNNSDRQLGCSIPDQYIGPLEVSLPDSIKSVTCGNQHTVVLTEQGDVYICGRGDRGQLGLGRQVSMARNFEIIENLPKNVTDISAGEAHTIIVDSLGNFYVFGDGKYGKLSFESYSYEFKPIFIDKFQGYNIFKVVCGGCQTIILAENKSIENIQNTISLKTKPIKSILHTNSVDETSDTTNTKLQLRRTEFKFNYTVSLNNTINNVTRLDYTDNLSKNTNSDSEISSCNERSIPLFDQTNRYDLHSPASTNSGCTSSSTSSIENEKSMVTSDSNDNPQVECHSSKDQMISKTYQIKPNIDSTIVSLPKETKSRFFSKIFGKKPLPKLTKTTNNNSRTCSIM